ncbi:N-acetylglucosamine kinase [Auraticoccus sp. F435]|uniref:N-acetylglucosamine kinase n=2 Tax=Auraticoccus cholistanensis TaxID=2656650 RepID=A0A6A9V1Y2_9ACTN|nr:BadF/BadG/BcrA/BcrD ATPase family protein [Auraticoccus cholistanensis]MVA77574.1 N-acetylglucosamine kinase [Auraticoccus cholistanensis]
MGGRLYLGVDGGGTKTALCLVDDHGRLLAEHRAPSVYYFNAGLELVGAVLVPAVTEVCRRAGVTPDDVTAAFVGLPGYGEASADLPALDAAPAAALGHDRYVCGNDMVCGWAGSLGGRDGINVVSGTGSVAYGERDGRSVRVGGWSELFSDEGSAYWIAVRGLQLFTRMSDGRLPPGPLLEVLRDHLGLAGDLDLVDLVVNRWGGDRATVAALCPRVVEAAGAGDEAAAAVLEEAAAELATLAAVTRRRLGFAEQETVAVSWSGGVFGAAPVREGFRRAVLAEHPATVLVTPLLSPVLGAAVHAARLAGTPLGEDAVARLAAAG